MKLQVLDSFEHVLFITFLSGIEFEPAPAGPLEQPALWLFHLIMKLHAVPAFNNRIARRSGHMIFKSEIHWLPILKALANYLRRNSSTMNLWDRCRYDELFTFIKLITDRILQISTKQGAMVRHSIWGTLTESHFKWGFTWIQLAQCTLILGFEENHYSLQFGGHAKLRNKL